MRIIAIKDMSAGNESIGEMWQETKIFEHWETVLDVIAWAGLKKKVTLSIPDNYEQGVIDLALKEATNKE